MCGKRNEKRKRFAIETQWRHLISLDYINFLKLIWLPSRDKPHQFWDKKHHSPSKNFNFFRFCMIGSEEKKISIFQIFLCLTSASDWPFCLLLNIITTLGLNSFFQICNFIHSWYQEPYFIWELLPYIFAPWAKTKTWWLEVKYHITEADGMPNPCHLSQADGNLMEFKQRKCKALHLEKNNPLH